jgi:hypothetical protein
MRIRAATPDIVRGLEGEKRDGNVGFHVRHGTFGPLAFRDAERHAAC